MTQVTPLDGTKPIHKYRLSAYTGPTSVLTIAEKLQSAGLIGVGKGTETVYWSIFANDPHAALARSRQILLTEYDSDFGLWHRPGAAKVLREY